MRLASRVLRHQFRPTGLVHLAVVHETDALERPWTHYAVVSGTTLCGKNIDIGSGGWGYGPKACPKCDSLGAVAERLP